MTEPAEPTSTNPFAQPGNETLKAIVIGLGVLLVLAAGVFVWALARELNEAEEPEIAEAPPAPAAYEAATASQSWWRGAQVISQLALPEGAEVSQLSLGGDRLALLVETESSAEIVLFDLVELKKIGVISLVEQEKADASSAPASSDGIEASPSGEPAP